MYTICELFRAGLGSTELHTERPTQTLCNESHVKRVVSLLEHPLWLADGSSEIQPEDLHRREHPREPLIPDLTRPPSRRKGSLKDWITRTATIGTRSTAPMDPPNPLDLKLDGLFLYHLTDWLFIVLLIALEVVCQIVTPYKRYVGQWMFVTGELRYPLKNNTVPFQLVPVIAVVIPLICIGFYYLWRRNVRDMHHAVLGLLTTVVLTAVITDALKDAFGRPRPDFYARCFGSPIATPAYDIITGNVICSGDATTMKEAYKSFPSGHTSWSFAGTGYLSLYLAGKLGIFDKRGHLWKLFPMIFPLIVATFIAITRVDDYWHHWTDVCAGATLGLGAAYFCYRQHFPSLSDEHSHIPYAHIPGARSSQAKGPIESPSEWQPRSYDVERGNREAPSQG